LLQPRRRAEHALLAVVQEAYVHGVSTRKVDDLVKALGVDGISRSEVSRICGELDTVVAAFRTRPLTGEHRYLWVDATYHKVRVDGRVISQATVVAVGVTTEGDRQVLGIDVGPSEDRAFWTAFLRSLVKRGLKGVRLVISDAHEGLKQAISTVLSGSTWQRCRVHFMRNLLATVPQGAREAIAAFRTIFAQPDHASALTQLRKVADGLRTRFPRAATVLEEAAEDILGVPASADGASATAAQHEPARAPEQGAIIVNEQQAGRRSIGSRHLFAAEIAAGELGPVRDDEAHRAVRLYDIDTLHVQFIEPCSVANRCARRD
jgi:transposase-like protein